MSSGGGFLGNFIQQLASGVSQLDGILNVEGATTRRTGSGRGSENRSSSSSKAATTEGPSTSRGRGRGGRRGPTFGAFDYFMGNGVSCGNPASAASSKKNRKPSTRGDSDFVFVDGPSAVGAGCAESPMFCDNCNARFGRCGSRKRECQQCRHLFCVGCMRGGEPVCFRCKILLRKPSVRADLLELRVKDLQRFLMSRHVSTKDCVEKKDLVELVMKENGGGVGSRRGAASRPEEAAGGTGVANAAAASGGGVVERQRQSFPKSYVTSTHRSELFDRLEEDDCPSRDSQEEEEAEEAEPAAADEVATDALEFELGPEKEEDAVEEEEEVAAEAAEESVVAAASCSAVDDKEASSTKVEVPSSPKRSFANQGLVYLSDIRSPSDVDELSAKQAKDILAMNRVNFKGVVEKAELLKIVSRLWLQEKRLQEGKQEMDDDELCKVCMDSPVDCVMLECGHMCTCTNCGKQMAECPICRQYVIRVVKTFKA